MTPDSFRQKGYEYLSLKINVSWVVIFYHLNSLEEKQWIKLSWKIKVILMLLVIKCRLLDSSDMPVNKGQILLK